ncbi:hypothetical protein HAX54_007382 [Datura stramonium]|uniref:H15 domain-containing protein n=1 Tax=Datura stramonium TaxID=4076 RepID=A0ABS8RUT1_DATST|nr:hypothetical protein [Datura stramonium]
MDQNPCKNPNVQQQQQQQQKKKNHEGSMDKLREAILKLSNSAPNGPLSITQNSFLQQSLTNFLSCLHTTPDHPPYAWMIEKALRELNEKGGSSEDSIAKFIKKEYDSLPWAHMTLLKHHLQKMSEKGEILMIDGGRFLLPADSENLSRKRQKKRKYVKRKRSGTSETKQRKPQQKEKEEEKLVQHYDVELVGEQEKLDEQQNEVTVKRTRRGSSEIKQKKPWQKEKEEKRVQHDDAEVGEQKKLDDVEIVGEQKKLDKQQNEVTDSGNHGKENRIREEYRELNEHQNERSTDKEHGQLSGQQNYVTGNKVNDKPDILLLQSPTGFEAVSIDKSSQTDRSQRQLKRWNKSSGDLPKSISTSEVEPLPPLALATREEVLNLTDPQHKVQLEQPKQQRCGRLLRSKEDKAKKDKSKISTLATNEEVHLKQQKEERCWRALRGKEDGADPDTTLLKNLVTKKQNGGGPGRRRKAQ